MKITHVLPALIGNARFFFKKDAKMAMHRNSIALNGLAAAGLKIKYISAEGELTSIPRWIIPDTRISRNMLSQGFSPEALGQVVNLIQQQFDLGILNPGDEVLLQDYLSLKGASVAIMGATYGDEGKARVAYFMTSHINSHSIVRFNGSSNAGKIIITDDMSYEFIMLPAGAVHPNVEVYFAQGVLLDLPNLLTEVGILEKHEIPTRGRLHISSDCHLVLPFHIEVSTAKNIVRNREKAHNSGMAEGSTNMGVGAAVEDMVARRGIRIRDLYNGTLRTKVASAARIAEGKIRSLTGDPHFSFPNGYVENICRQYEAYAKQIQDLVHYNLTSILEEKILKGEKIVFEGSQSALLDIHHGMYPDSTSTCTTLGGLIEGTGLRPELLPVRIGVLKTYLAIRGKTPLPSEMDEASAAIVREEGKEYEVAYGADELPLYEADGRTLKYDRSKKIAVGWHDQSVLRHLGNVGYTHLILTKLDVLDSFDTIPIVTCLKYHGPLQLNHENFGAMKSSDGTTHLTSFVNDPQILKDCTSVYLYLPGWAAELKERGITSISDIKTWEDLPRAAQNYVRKIAELTGVPIAMVSVGPKKDQIIAVPY